METPLTRIVERHAKHHAAAYRASGWIAATNARNVPLNFVAPPPVEYIHQLAPDDDEVERTLRGFWSFLGAYQALGVLSSSDLGNSGTWEQIVDSFADSFLGEGLGEVRVDASSLPSIVGLLEDNETSAPDDLEHLRCRGECEGLNRMQQCGDVTAEGGTYVCTMPDGHEGDHVSCGISPHGNGYVHGRMAWLNVQPTDDALGDVSPDEDDAPSCMFECHADGVTCATFSGPNKCSLPVRHHGPHVTCSGSEHVIASWQDSDARVAAEAFE